MLVVARERLLSSSVRTVLVADDRVIFGGHHIDRELIVGSARRREYAATIIGQQPSRLWRRRRFVTDR